MTGPVRATLATLVTRRLRLDPLRAEHAGALIEGLRDERLYVTASPW